MKNNWNVLCSETVAANQSLKWGRETIFRRERERKTWTLVKKTSLNSCDESLFKISICSSLFHPPPSIHLSAVWKLLQTKITVETFKQEQKATLSCSWHQVHFFGGWVGGGRVSFNHLEEWFPTRGPPINTISWSGILLDHGPIL